MQSLKTLKNNFINENTILDYNNVFITMDMDWANDDVLSYIINLVESLNIKVIMFVTHYTPKLEEMRNSPNFQLGIHPNFNPLLNGDFQYGDNVKKVLEYFINIVPETTMIRSHSVTQSTIIKSLYEQFNIKYDLNLFIPEESKITLFPFTDAFNIINLPYFWEDDVHVINKFPFAVDKYLSNQGLKIFDFHPIHIYLNSESLTRYNNIKTKLQDTTILKQNRNIEQFGVENFFNDLVSMLGQT